MFNLARFMIVLLLSGGAISPAASEGSGRYDQWITAALDHAFHGAFKDTKSAKQMKEIYAKSEDPGQRAVAAYLLSLNPKLAKPIEMEDLITTALAVPDPVDVLGKKAYIRLLRERADAFYNAGEFQRAEQDFVQIATLSEGLIREYALLKKGWCLFNRNLPDLAFDFWLKTLSEESKTLHASPTWFQSIGQAIAENKSRRKDDIEELTKLCDTEDKIQFAAEGILDGSLTLVEPRDAAELAAALAGTAWYSILPKTVEERLHPRGQQACLALNWFDKDPREKSNAPGALQILESCDSSAPASDHATQMLLLRVSKKLELKANQRRIRFVFQTRNKLVREACGEGLEWLLEMNPDAEFPAVAVTEQCVQGADKNLAEKAIELLKQTLLTPDTLKGSESAYAFLFSELVKNAAFRNSIFEYWTTDAALLSATDIPRWLAEQAYAQEDSAQSERLLADHLSRPTPSPNPSIWGQIAKRQLDHSLSGGESDAGYSALQRYFPIRHGEAPAANVRAAWAKWILDHKESPPNKDTSRAAVQTVLNAAQGAAADYAVFLDLALDLDSTDVAAEAAMRLSNWEKLPAAVKNRAEDEFFRRWVRTPPPNVAANLSRDLKFIETLAADLRDATANSALDLKPWGGSQVASDLAHVQSLDRRSSKVLKKTAHRPLLVQIPLWVDFLKSGLGQLQKHAWIDPSLSELGYQTMRDFCHEASAQLNKHPVDSLDGNWKAAHAQLQTRFSECETVKAKGPTT